MTQQLELKYKTIVICYLCINGRKLGTIIFDGMTDIVFAYYNSYTQEYREFMQTAKIGQLFLKYTGKKRRKPQDRIIKVTFDDNEKPIQISWGSGSRHIQWNDLLYISHGHWTPVFQARKDMLNPKLCFSVVGKQQILDILSENQELVGIWVKGLRMLLDQCDEEADRLSKKMLAEGNLAQTKQKPKSSNNNKPIIWDNNNLFVITTTIVFSNLEEEGWHIDQYIREKFNTKMLHEEALREDIPWRQWNYWIRQKIVTYLTAVTATTTENGINNDRTGKETN
eukprot:270238_1